VPNNLRGKKPGQIQEIKGGDHSALVRPAGDQEDWGQICWKKGGWPKSRPVIERKKPRQKESAGPVRRVKIYLKQSRRIHRKNGNASSIVT